MFIVSMRDIRYQAKKEARAKIDSKYIIPQKYHNFLDICSKKDSDILPPYCKYDLKIHLKKE